MRKTPRTAVVFALACALLVLLPSCSREPGDSAPGGEDGGVVELELWTYPVGGWGSSTVVSSLTAAFNRDNPGIRVTVRYLDYDTGDAEVEAAIERGEAPDLILEGPERLRAVWGARGLLADVSDIWEGEPSREIYDTVRVACFDSDGKSYIYPLCMTTHCMAINRGMFEASGAWRYVDAERHTWTTEGFFSAVKALYDYGIKEAAAVYCGGQGGDQGTRALVTNLCGGSFTNAEHTSYAVNSPENIRALGMLASADGIVFEPTLTGADEIELFSSGKLAMAFCWNVFMEIRETVNNKSLDFDIFPMAFPTESGEPQLQGGIWGFGIFDSGDEARVSAAKTFIRFMTESDENYKRAVLASTYWPCRPVADIYANDKLMNEYGIFGGYLGDYYQITPNWAESRAAWQSLLRGVGEGLDPAEAAARFDAEMKQPSP